MRFLHTVLIVFLLSYGTITAAATVEYAGILSSVKGVDVEGNGVLFDATFVNQSCTTAGGDIGLRTEAFADLGLQQLKDILMVEQGQGRYKGVTDPCTGHTTFCSLAVSTFTISDSVKGRDFEASGSFGLILDTSRDLDENPSVSVYVKWEPAVVPIPAAAWLFGSALLGLVTVSRRKKLKA